MIDHRVKSMIWLAVVWVVAGLVVSIAQAGLSEKPNFVVILFDDLGYGDLGCYGDEKMKICTPHIDRLAAGGARFTDFYVSCSVCGPSRASIMTGRYPQRCGMALQLEGLPTDEITIAEVLKSQGYATACVGKWHLGDTPPRDSNNQGFDYFYGLGGNAEAWLPILENGKVVDEPVIPRETLTTRYTEHAIDFIRDHRSGPFFLYLSHTHPHDPQAASERFLGKSEAGLYGDVVEELDESVGQIIDALTDLGIDDRTLVVVTSDNGADYNYFDGKIDVRDGEGSNRPLRGGKCATEEGGLRVPAIFSWPGKIDPHQTCHELATAMDLLPTFAKLSGAELPGDRVIDGKNIWPLLSQGRDALTPHEAFFYYNGLNLQAVRAGKWKLHLPRTKEMVPYWQTTQGICELDHPLLFDLEADVGEENDLVAKYPDVVSRLQILAEQCRDELGDSYRTGRDRKKRSEWKWSKSSMCWKLVGEVDQYLNLSVSH